MILNSWPEAAAIVSSVVAICGTTLKIYFGKKDDAANKRSDSAEEDTRVLAAKIKQLEKEVEHLHNCIDRIQENFIKLLTENWHEDI